MRWNEVTQSAKLCLSCRFSLSLFSINEILTLSFCTIGIPLFMYLAMILWDDVFHVSVSINECSLTPGHDIERFRPAIAVVVFIGMFSSSVSGAWRWHGRKRKLSFHAHCWHTSSRWLDGNLAREKKVYWNTWNDENSTVYFFGIFSLSSITMFIQVFSQMIVKKSFPCSNRERRRSASAGITHNVKIHYFTS